MRRHLPVSIILIMIGSAAALHASCGGERPTSRNEQTRSAAPNLASGSAATDWFVDRASQSGLDFVYVNGMSGQFYFPEMMGGGVALFDYDNDGDLDIYFAQGRPLGSSASQDAGQTAPAGGGRLYRNDLTIQPDGSRVLHFTDVTAQSGIHATEYGMGVATGDFNNDGCVDLYLTNFGPNRLYRNNCDGTFTDVSQASGVTTNEWSVSATFVDYDRDGWLDLYVGNYVQYSIANDQKCTNLTGRRDYCTPAVYSARTDRLYHNQHDGTFADVTATALVGGQFGPALGVTAADFNGDGWPDIYVANDGKPNLLWMNQHDGTFKNTGLLSGTALAADGKPKGSMGVDAGDFDNDGDEDLFTTQLPTEGANLYVNDGTGLFEDRSNASGLGALTRGYTGFGTAWFDYDNDGWLDLFTANGSIEAQKARLSERFPYDERNLLLRNLRDGRFANVTTEAGEAFRQSGVNRGAAFGDIDNDGDVDIVVSRMGQPAQLLINTVGNRMHWLGLRMIGSRRDMLGAQVHVIRRNTPTLSRRARSDGSYGSANDPRVLIGLGESSELPDIRVVWPNGVVQEWSKVAIDRWTTLTQSASPAR